MSFIVGVLILGALLSAVFGRRVGALFVVGSTAAFCVVAVPVLLLFLALVIGMVTTPSSLPNRYAPSYTAPSYGPTSAPSYGSAPVSGDRSADYDRAIMSAADAALSPVDWRCPTDPQARLRLADRYWGVAEYIRQRAPYADPGKPGLYEDYAKECDHVASHLADLGETLPPSTTPLDLSR